MLNHNKMPEYLDEVCKEFGVDKEVPLSMSKKPKPRVKSTVHVSPTKDLNEWARHIYEWGNNKRGYEPKKSK